VSDALIYDAVRTPRGRGRAGGALHTARPVELLQTALLALQQRNELDTASVDDVVIGCVTQTGEQGACIARTAALGAGWDHRVPGATLNRFCGSGLEAIQQAAARVASGFEHCLVAGGVESMSRVPMGSDGGAMLDVQTQWAVGFVPQGISADLLATREGLTRVEVDAFAVRSQQRAGAAWAAGHFDRSVVPVYDQGVLLLDRDEHLRPDTTLEQLAALKPAFQMMGETFGVDALVRSVYPEVERVNHVHHAGNASGIVDGAAAVLVGSRALGARYGRRPRAKIRSYAVVGDEPLLMLTGPIPATKLALKRAGLSVRDIDLFEVNEAFAAVPLVYQRAFDLDPDRVNVDGGAIALGHPLGATGAMLLGTALDALERTDGTFALITLCIGGGMGVATILERV